MKQKLRVSFSGGRTSAFMCKWLLDNKSDVFDMRFVFANTGREHEDTLRFVNDVDRNFGLNLTWVEAVVHPGRKSCGHRLVSYETASRNGEPFEAVVGKYGLPNQTFKLCTRELKTNPMQSFSNSIGWTKGTFKTAIGIRADEQRRVADSAVAQFIVYPLVDMIPTDKLDVLMFFEQFPWDLKIAEHEGNCVDCHRKSDKKLNLQYRQSPAVFDFPRMLDKKYSNVGPNNVPGPRKRFRGRRSTEELIAAFEAMGYVPPELVQEGGCSESCELYETQAIA